MTLECKEFESPELQNCVAQTLSILRKMRGAAAFYGARDGVIVSNEVLSDAKSLAQACSIFLVGFGLKQGDPEFYATWVQNQQHLADKYRYFKPLWTSGANGSAAGVRVLSKLDCFITDEYLAATGVFLNYSGSSVIRAEDFSTGRIGIMSPLSTDYLIACCFSEWVHRRFLADSPPVEPVLLDAFREEILGGSWPVNSGFKGQDRVIVLVDTPSSPSKTLETMDLIARRQYPQKYWPQFLSYSGR